MKSQLWKWAVASALLSQTNLFAELKFDHLSTTNTVAKRMFGLHAGDVVVSNEFYTIAIRVSADWKDDVGSCLITPVEHTTGQLTTMFKPGPNVRWSKPRYRKENGQVLVRFESNDGQFASMFEYVIDERHAWVGVRSVLKNDSTAPVLVPVIDECRSTLTTNLESINHALVIQSTEEAKPLSCAVLPKSHTIAVLRSSAGHILIAHEPKAKSDMGMSPSKPVSADSRWPKDMRDGGNWLMVGANEGIMVERRLLTTSNSNEMSVLLDTAQFTEIAPMVGDDTWTSIAQANGNLLNLPKMLATNDKADQVAPTKPPAAKPASDVVAAKGTADDDDAVQQVAYGDDEPRRRSLLSRLFRRRSNDQKQEKPNSDQQDRTKEERAAEQKQLEEQQALEKQQALENQRVAEQQRQAEAQRRQLEERRTAEQQRLYAQQRAAAQRQQQTSQSRDITGRTTSSTGRSQPIQGTLRGQSANAQQNQMAGSAQPSRSPGVSPTIRPFPFGNGGARTQSSSQGIAGTQRPTTEAASARTASTGAGLTGQYRSEERVSAKPTMVPPPVNQRQPDSQRSRRCRPSTRPLGQHPNDRRLWGHHHWKHGWSNRLRSARLAKMLPAC